MDQSQKIYTLLVGIAQYPLPVRSLAGCLNDVAAIENFLHHFFDRESLHIRKLINEDGLRKNIIAGFREHLAQAEEGDLVWFHFSGHGSRQKSAQELTQAGLSSDGMDETLVCYDSRSPEGRDLADKEIALLLEELAPNKARIICTFDSCHSGNITREDGSSLPDPNQWNSRQWDSRTDSILLEDYLEGQYSAMESLYVPEPTHLALSACRRDQKAFEAEGKGFFTHTLMEALDKLGGDPGISELYHYLRLHFAHHFDSSSFRQTPVIESYGGFPITSRLFSGTKSSVLLRKKIYRDAGSWWVSLGAIDGMQPGVEATLTDHQGLTIGKATVTHVGPEKSRLHLPDVPPTQPLFLETSHAIQETVSVFMDLPTTPADEIRETILQKCAIKLQTCDQEQAEILFTEQDNRLLMARNNPYTELRTERLTDPNTPDVIAEAIGKYVRWRRGHTIQGSGIPMGDISFYFANYPDQAPFPGKHLLLQITHAGERKKVLLMAENKGLEPLWFTLLYFSRECGIRAFLPLPVPEGSVPKVLYGSEPRHYFYLPDHYSRNTDCLRLLVSREKPDWTLIGQDGIGPGNTSRNMAPEGVVVDGLDWGMVDLWLGLER